MSTNQNTFGINNMETPKTPNRPIKMVTECPGVIRNKSIVGVPREALSIEPIPFRGIFEDNPRMPRVKKSVYE